MKSELLEQKIKQLTSEEQEQVLKFVEDFLNKKKSLTEYLPSFNWAGGLEHLKNKYTSVALQKQINEWW